MRDRTIYERQNNIRETEQLYERKNSYIRDRTNI
jgi:hypothetical protein